VPTYVPEWLFELLQNGKFRDERVMEQEEQMKTIVSSLFEMPARQAPAPPIPAARELAPDMGPVAGPGMVDFGGTAPVGDTRRPPSVAAEPVSPTVGAALQELAVPGGSLASPPGNGWLAPPKPMIGA
jgi:hypothetical protein